MSRSLHNISRALSAYGDRASAIQSRGAREAAMFRTRAADARARGIQQRGQNLSSMVSGIGGMVGQGLMQAPQRQRDMQRQDLEMRAGEQQLEMGEANLAQAKKARDEEETYIDILSKHRGNPSAVIEALHKAEMPERANNYYQGMMKTREAIAKADKAETEETAARFRNLAELFLRFQENTPEEEWESAYPVVRMQAEKFLEGTAPELMEQLPETPDAATFKFMRNIGVRSRDLSDRLLAEEKIVNTAKKNQDLRQSKIKAEDDNFLKGLQSMSRVRSQGAWETQREFLLEHRISEDQVERFNSLVPMEYSKEAKDGLKEFMGDSKKLPDDYQAARDTGFEGSYLDFVEKKAEVSRAEKEEEEKKKITPSQALANLRALATATKERQYEEQFEGMNKEQISQFIANEWGWDLEKFRRIAGGGEAAPPEGEVIEEDVFRVGDGVEVRVNEVLETAEGPFRYLGKGRGWEEVVETEGRSSPAPEHAPPAEPRQVTPEAPPRQVIPAPLLARMEIVERELKTLKRVATSDGTGQLTNRIQSLERELETLKKLATPDRTGQPNAQVLARMEIVERELKTLKRVATSDGTGQLTNRIQSLERELETLKKLAEQPRRGRF